MKSPEYLELREELDDLKNLIDERTTFSSDELDDIRDRIGC